MSESIDDAAVAAIAAGNLPQPVAVVDTSVNYSKPNAPGTRGVYTLITRKSDKKAFQYSGNVRAYMQQNVNDPNRPDGHMYIELEIDDTLATWSPPHDKIAGNIEYSRNTPSRDMWWRVFLANPTATGLCRKMTTSSVEIDTAPSTNSLLIEQWVI